MSRSWFKTKECLSLDIKKYKSISEHQVVSAVTIEDTKVIERIMNRIEKIPTNGDMMVSFGPSAEHISLDFKCAENLTQTIAIYQKKFKTPSTGFNSAREEIELSLYADIDALLFPAPNKKILKIKNLELKFNDFSLTYMGEKNSGETPVTVAWVSDEFNIKENSHTATYKNVHTEQIINISSGQLPPKPHNFTIGKTGFSLLTYEAKPNKQPDQHNQIAPNEPAARNERLYPEYFQIVRQ